MCMRDNALGHMDELGNWTREITFASLKVHNLKTCLQETYYSYDCHTNLEIHQEPLIVHFKKMAL